MKPPSEQEYYMQTTVSYRKRITPYFVAVRKNNYWLDGFVIVFWND